MKSIRSALAGEGQMKRCKECGKMLPLIAFHRRKEQKDGRYSLCRNCANLRRQSRRKKRRADMRAAMEGWDQ